MHRKAHFVSLFVFLKPEKWLFFLCFKLPPFIIFSNLEDIRLTSVYHKWIFLRSNNVTMRCFCNFYRKIRIFDNWFYIRQFYAWSGDALIAYFQHLNFFLWRGFLLYGSVHFPEVKNREKLLRLNLSRVISAFKAVS